MALSRRHFNPIAQSFRQARAALLRAKAPAIALAAFDQCVYEVAEQLASAAGTFSKPRFLLASGVTESSQQHPTATNSQEPNNV